MTKQELQQLIISYIYENNSEDISGSILQNILIQISDKLSDGLYFGGVVNDESVLTPDINSFYLCLNSGTYQSFDDVVVEDSNKIQYLFHDGTFWNVGELPIPTFDFINIAKSSLYGGVITPNEEPTYGNDHRYFYLAFQEGRYTHFNNNYVDSQVCLFYWSESLSNWLMLALWENSESLSNLFSGKADRVNNPTNGHLVGIDAEGSLIDSGIAASDVITTVDNALSSTSENPVQNKVIKSIIDALNAAKQDLLPDGSVFGGFVGPSTADADTKYFYLTDVGGLYPYFNNAYVNDDSLTLFYYKNNSWQNAIIAPSYQLASKALLSEDLYVTLGFPLFDSSLDYAQGDVVVYGGYLYVFTTDHNGQWDESDVEYDDIFKEFKNLYVSLVQQIPEISTNILTDATSDIKATSPKAVKTFVENILANLIADGALYGGFAWPNEPPTYGDDHRYFYLAYLAGSYPAFDTELAGNMLVMFYWLEDAQEWTSNNLTMTPTGIEELLSPKMDITELYTRLGFLRFSPYLNYSVGDYVVNEGFLYKFTSNHAAGQWDDNDVVEASLLDYITDYVSKQLSGKQDVIPVVDASTIPASMDADKLYDYGTLSGDITFPSLNTPSNVTNAHVFWWTFKTGSTAPNVGWPVSGITEWSGGSPPNIDPSTTYEIMVSNGFASYIKST